MDTMIEEAPAPKKPAKKKVKARTKAAPRTAPAEKPTADGIFTGLTVTDCCDDCNVDGCVISGKPYCAHPRKGSLHSAQMSDPPAVKRLSQAKRILGKQMLVVRGE